MTQAPIDRFLSCGIAVRSCLFAALLGALISGCSTYSAAAYSISPNDVEALKSLQAKGLNVGPFVRRGINGISCGTGVVKMPNRESVSEFVRNALIEELRAADAYSTTAPVTLIGNLESIAYSPKDNTWTFELTVETSNGRTMTVTGSHSDASAVDGMTTCDRAAATFAPAVQQLLGKVVRSRDFNAFVSS